jgi:hypothetical protein
VIDSEDVERVELCLHFREPRVVGTVRFRDAIVFIVVEDVRVNTVGRPGLHRVPEIFRPTDMPRGVVCWIPRADRDEVEVFAAEAEGRQIF